MPDPQIRAADVDREAVARRLGEHMAAGRLSVTEFEDRTARAYAAKTYGELAALTADLPSPGRAPASVPRPAARAGACGQWAHARPRSAAWASWFTIGLVVTAIWLITSIASGGLVYFWPIWVIGPWGAALLLQSLGGSHHRRGYHPRSHYRGEGSCRDHHRRRNT